MVIYDLEKFLIEFGFLKKDDQLASLYKEFIFGKYIISIYRLASLKSKIKDRMSSDKYKISFIKSEVVESKMRILPLKGSIGMMPLSNIKSERISTIKEITDYEEMIGESIKDIISSIKEEMPAECRKYKINKIIKSK